MKGDWGLPYLAGVPFRHRASRARLGALRDRRVGWLVRHTAKHIPFYKELLQQHNVNPRSIGGFQDLERLPLVTRRMLREAGERAWATDVPHSRRTLASTSGSTDKPLTLAFSFEDRLRKHAISLHCMSLYGWRPWHRGMALGSQALPRDHRLQRLGFSRWHWVDPTRPVSEWLEDYDRVRPQALHAYPSALREFCFQARERGPLQWLPRVLSVGGELCPEELAPLTHDVFGVAPLSMYGAVEGGRLAFECREHAGLHVRLDGVHVEILAGGQSVEAGQPGSVYITSLINTVMPIIRYELGDLATWVPGECRCGLWWPRIVLHQGRRSDVVSLSGGRHVPITNLATIVGKSRAIRQFQFVRRADNHLVLRYEPQGDTAESLEQIHHQLRDALPGITVELEMTGQLPRTRSGKVSRLIDESESNLRGAAKKEAS
ncbi:MAG: hypothetical protein KJO70_05420 [Gammaproteobacteria bacterium]|nr:hypothetical protein [Gammaproteobacteria bacterium]